MTPALLAPAALGLAVLIAGPVLAHLARRQPRQEVAYGAMLLLRRLQKRQRRRRRLHDLLLLLLRVLAVAAVVAAVARPELRWPEADPAAEVPGPVVVVLDNSLSMDQRVGELGSATVFSQARDAAAAWVRALPEGSRAGVVSIGGPAMVHTPELVTDRGAVADTLAGLQQSHGTTDLVGGLQLARRLLDGEGGRVVVFTDEAGPEAVPAARGELELYSRQNIALVPRVVRGPTAANVVVTGAEYGDGVEGGTVRVTLANHGPVPVEVPLVVALPDGTEITAFAELPAEGVGEEMVTVPRVTDGGVAVARVDDPSLPADDAYAFHLPRVGASRVLVVDGDPGLTPTASEVYFLERALAPWGPGRVQAGVLPEITPVAGVARLDPAVHRVVMLANVSDPSGIAPRLTDFVRRGGGLVIALGDNVTAENYNGALAGLLPAPLRRPRSLAAPGEKGEPTALPAAEVALFSPFVRGGRAGFGRVHWRTLATLEPFAADDERRVLLETESGLPLLVERRVGLGRVLLFTGTLDLGWGDFPLQAVYMPFVQRLVSYLGGETGGGGARVEALVDEVVNIDAPGDLAALGELEITGPDGPVAARVRSDGVSFVPRRPGAYTLRSPGAPPVAWVAVNPDARESDLRPGPALVELAAEVDPERYQRREDLAPWLLGLGLLAALGAALLSFVFAGRPGEAAAGAADPSASGSPDVAA